MNPELPMPEPTITCPHCGAEIPLTESLAAPIIAATRRSFEKQLAEKDQAVAAQEAALRAQQDALGKERAAIDTKIRDGVARERQTIAADEAAKARAALEQDMARQRGTITELETSLREREGKLAEAQQAQAEALRLKRELEDKSRELELTIEKRVQESLTGARDQARREAEEHLQMKLSERDLQISSLQQKIDELKRRAEQGSQQLQGEVLELELETQLRGKFPMDAIEPVPKGEHGGDIVQRVLGAGGQACGAILWETKRTKNWSDGWLTKLREDQRAAKAEVAILLSYALPKDVEAFDCIDGIWVAHPRVALPMAAVLRQSLLEIALARQAGEGQQTKMEMMYDYLTGPRFRQRVEAIVEAFSSMKDDLAKERTVITKQWAKRDQQIERVMLATVGMYGDLQGIAGASLLQVEGLELKALENC
jgi:hypothetical protein